MGEVEVEEVEVEEQGESEEEVCDHVATQAAF